MGGQSTGLGVRAAVAGCVSAGCWAPEMLLQTCRDTPAWSIDGAEQLQHLVLWPQPSDASTPCGREPGQLQGELSCWGIPRDGDAPGERVVQEAAVARVGGQDLHRHGVIAAPRVRKAGNL